MHWYVVNKNWVSQLLLTLYANEEPKRADRAIPDAKAGAPQPSVVRSKSNNI